MLFNVFLAFGFSSGFNPPIDIHIPDRQEIAEMICEEYNLEENSMVSKEHNLPHSEEHEEKSE